MLVPLNRLLAVLEPRGFPLFQSTPRSTKWGDGQPWAAPFRTLRPSGPSWLFPTHQVPTGPNSQKSFQFPRGDQPASKRRWLSPGQTGDQGEVGRSRWRCQEYKINQKTSHQYCRPTPPSSPAQCQVTVMLIWHWAELKMTSLRLGLHHPDTWT